MRRVAKGALYLESEVARLTRLLREAGVDPRRRSTIMSLRMEVERLRKAVPGAEIQARKIRQLNKALWKEQVDNGSLRRLLHDTVRRYDSTRMLRDQQGQLALLSEEHRQLRRELKTADKLKDRLKARLLRAAEKARSLSPTAQDAELRKALRRSRHRKTALNALRKENAGCGGGRRYRRAGSGRWKRSLRSCARLRRCCRRRSTGGAARSWRRRAPVAVAASSRARPVTAARHAPGSRSGSRCSTHRSKRVTAPVAGSPTWGTAPTSRRCWRSRYAPTGG